MTLRANHALVAFVGCRVAPADLKRAATSSSAVGAAAARPRDATAAVLSAFPALPALDNPVLSSRGCVVSRSRVERARPGGIMAGVRPKCNDRGGRPSDRDFGIQAVEMVDDYALDPSSRITVG